MTATKLFDVYGATRGGSGASTTKQGFVGGLGHETDDETGLVYMRARYYDPGLWRFISEDPKRNGGNWFEYGDNNPTNQVDVTGCNPVLILGALSVVLAGCVGGLMECVADGWNWPTFWRGAAFAAATTLGGLLGGPLGGAIVGALAGWLDAYLTGGNQMAGAMLGGIFGAAGGAVAVPGITAVGDVIGKIGAEEVAIFLLLGADGGLGQGAVSEGVSNL
jgi:RHS repeat-associated protein